MNALIPSNKEILDALESRHTKAIQDKISNASVAILGLGGLGSAVAGSLTKIGVGKLVLSDYDRVDISNLNRQHYFIDQIGRKKTDALKENLRRMNPLVKIELIDKFLSESDIKPLFSNVDIIAECFDNPSMKASAMRAVISTMGNTAFVGASGMAGYGDNNDILTKKIRNGVYIVGDLTSEAKPGHGLMAPRVGIAAHHQANQILRIILGAC